MAALSISDAMGEPFRLIRERPLWVLLWGAPYAATLAIIVPLFALAFANMPLGEADTLTDAESQAMFGQMMSVQIASMLLNVVQIGAGVMIWAAVNRAVLSGRAPDRWAHFRFSMDELHLLVIGILLVVGLYVGLIVIAILAAVVFGVTAYGSGAAPSAGWVFGLLSVVGLTLIAALAMAARTSLIAPASIHLKRLALPEGWRVAKGRTLPLMGLLALVVLIYMAIYLLTAGLIVGVVAAMVIATGAANGPAAETFGEVLPSTGTIVLWVAIALLPASFLLGTFMTIYVAPFAHAFRQLWESASRVSAAGVDPVWSDIATQGPTA